MTNFMTELLELAERAEETRRLEMNQLKADQLLAAIAVLEQKQKEVEDLVSEEMRLLSEYREAETLRNQKKVRWLAWNLEQYMKVHNAATSEKSLVLPHGKLALRKMPDKAEIADIDLFMKVGPKYRLVRQVPEFFEPDMKAIMHHVRTTGEVPAGVNYITGDIKFTYTTNGVNNEQRNEAEAGIAAKRNGNGQAAA